MKKLSAVLIVLVVVIVVMGFYRGWFSLSSPAPDTGSDKVNLNLTVDRDKMKQDADTVKRKTSELTGGAADRNTDANNPATDSVPRDRQ